MNRWRNRVAIVTAINSGIGVEIAKYLARAEMTVVGLSTRHSVHSVDLPEDVRGNIHISFCDTLNKQYIAKTFAQIEKKFGSSDVLVNNTLFYHPSFRDIQVETLKSFKAMTDIYDTNILRMILCTQEVLQSMKRRSFDGHVININSFVRPNAGNMKETYPTKIAITVLTEMLRQELLENSGVKITSIETGHVLIDANEHQFMPSPFTKDICDAVRYSLETSGSTNVQEIILKPSAAE